MDDGRTQPARTPRDGKAAMTSMRWMGSRIKSLLPAAWMITAAFFFATMGALAHAVGARCDWLLVAFIRIACTFVFSVALAWAGGARLVLWTPRTLWMRSAAGTLSLVCTFYALTHLAIADALTLTNTYPLWIVLVSTRLGAGAGWRTDLACVSSAVLGVVLIQAPYLSGGGDGKAVLSALAASLSAAVAMMGLHRLRSVDARAVVAHFSGLASLVLGALVAFGRPGAVASALDRPAVALLLGVGLCGTFGQVLLTRAFASGPPARISVLSLTQVVFGLGYDLILQTRRLTVATLLGFLMVVAPTAWIMLRAARRQDRSEPAEDAGRVERSLAS
jgi:drug/metabolite transporter (DMT)-like permease